MNELKSRVKSRLKDGKTALGVNLTVMHPDSIREVSNSGFDWVLFDLEHGPCTVETVNQMIQQISGSDASPIIRVVWDDRNAIKRALDTGAFGIIVPWVSTGEMAEEAVSYSKYPPAGLRGCGPGRAARAWGMTTVDYIDVANEELLVAVQIEREEAIDNLEDIVTVDGVDATWIGPADLSLSMGLDVGGAHSHPRVLEAMERVVEVCESAGVAPGIAAGGSAEYINDLIQRGFRFILVQGDLGLLGLGCESYLKEIMFS
jgi:2-keto-3-deoxy-L-rhamnonate aldolase RhmA